MSLRTYIVSILCCCIGVAPSLAGTWTTHFAYNNVTQIAMAPDMVYAISDGSLYSVDKETEQLRVYNRQSGLHATGITCIHYDEVGEQLIICYATGQIDLLSSRGVQYISGLYDKDMTQRKTIYNVTIKGRDAYLSTHYGVQVMNLRNNTMVDSYWLRPNGLETPIKDVLFTTDSIYAFADDSLYCAALSSNLVDYTFWKREARSSRIEPDAEKGVHYQDATSHWYRGYGEGIVRYTTTERLTYKPDGPLSNTPYSLAAMGSHVWVVPGGRWAAQYGRPGQVMHYNGQQWTNIPYDVIYAPMSYKPLDFVNIAVDPNDINHYYVSSYGTGLYEFLNDSVIRRDIAGGDNSLVSIVANRPTTYTRLDFATFDTNGNLWVLDACTHDQLHCRAADSTWHPINIVVDNQNLELHTPSGLVIDHVRPNYKWISTARANTCLCLMDDNHSPFDASDDRTIIRDTWTDQKGNSFRPGFIHAIRQDSIGRIWLVTDVGAAYVDTTTDFFTSDAIIRPDVMDNNGENPITSLRINGLCDTPNGDIWFATDGLGIYVLDHACTSILAHYTIDNSSLPSNTILSIACNGDKTVWIGTAEGLVEYETDDSGEGTDVTNPTQDGTDQGGMLQWRLHLSYHNPQEVVGTPKHIYAVANGSLFSVDRADESITYWSKANGLNGSTVAHIAYDAGSGMLIIGYEDGRIDLLSEDGVVTQMPDLYMKAGSIAVTINHICVGPQYSYLAMPFGIIAINTRKAEVTDTYYIGNNASSVEVQQIVQMGDSLYAFSYDSLYAASLRDNLVDFSFWHSTAIPFTKVQQAASFRNQLYALEDGVLYRRNSKSWSIVAPNKLDWIHESGQQLLTYEQGIGLLRLTGEEQLVGLSNNYVAQDAVYSSGEYWLAEEGKGLVRLNNSGDDFFHAVGPMNNFGYHLQAAHNRIYVAPGGRWADMFGRQSGLSIYDGHDWTTIPWQDTWYYTDHDIRDIVGYAVDNTDPGHFFAATYGTGVFEFRDYKAVMHYDSNNSTLRRATPGTSDYYFTRTDGAMMDEKGNFWVLNTTTVGQPVHVRTQAGQWYGLRMRVNGTDLNFNTPAGIWVDKRNSQWKWMIDQRSTTGLILLNDGGTPTNNSDDRCMKRNIFVDQNGNTLNPSFIFCFAQDQNNRIWLGTDKGVIIIPAEVDFFSSNACRRIIIPRNDGTGLGDYLLGDEQIKSLAVDGGNRMWIGTASSGLYLIEDDTITAAHFTENNSLLPSNSIQSIAIMPSTGEVFVGTDKGIASYRSDASEPAEVMTNAYAFPNPVRPNYTGNISIIGLMDDTEVRIVDSGGNLVCKTRSHGGTAVWDGRDAYGKRATPGVYTAFCNAQGGHTVVKILVIR